MSNNSSRLSVWLQTYYRINAWQFDPPLRDFATLRLDLNSHSFSLYLQYVHATEEHEPPQLLLRTLTRCEDISDQIACVFLGGYDGSDLKGSDGLSSFPQCYREFILKMNAQMDQMATDLFNLIRWRVGINGGPLKLKSDWSSMRWENASTTGDISPESGYLNRQVPQGVFSIGMWPMQHISLNKDCAEAVTHLMRSGIAQPFYHDLFREAWQSRRDRPSSALVIAIAAVETAFKTMAVELCDSKSTDWIFEKLQVPPLVLMIREYLELLPARQTFSGEVRRPPKHVIKTLQHGIELRNKIVHGRNPEMASESLDQILLVVRDLMYLFDFYRGYDWALERFTPEFKDAMIGGTS